MFTITSSSHDYVRLGILADLRNSVIFSNAESK